MNRVMKVYDEKGNEKEMQILFTTSLENYNKNYVFYLDPSDENRQVFVSSYDEDNHLEMISDDNEWADLEKVFEDFIKEAQHSCGGHCSGSCGDCDSDCDGNCNCGDDDSSCNCKK